MPLGQHAAEQQHPEVGGERRGETTYREDDEPRVEELACREAPDEKGRERDNDRLDERIAAREPLHGGGIDLEARHDGGKRGESSVWLSTASNVPASNTPIITMSRLLTPNAMPISPSSLFV